MPDRLSRTGKFVVGAAVFCSVILTTFFSHRTSGLQLLTLPLIPCFLVVILVSILCIFIDWGQRRWFSLLPFAGCVGCFILTGVAVHLVRHIIFALSLPSYEAVVRQMEAGTISVSTNLTSIPQAIPQARLAYVVFAQKDTNGELTVEFFTEGGFPVLHSGYLYVS